MLSLFFNFNSSIMKKLLVTLPIMLLVLFSCEDKTTAPSVQLPSNLVYTIKPSASIEGYVEVTATASLANYYGFEFFDENGSHLIENPEGQASYQFMKSGTYKITFRAHSTFDHFIEETDSVTVTVTAGGGIGIPTTGYTTPLSYVGYNLVWQDEFNGTALGNDWTHEVGHGNGWGNNELQYYRPENTEVRDGYLVITAKQEAFADRQYTSSRIITRGNQNFKYGRIDIRAALPKGKGLWPAVWMLGKSYQTIGWPECGEIDIMEMVGGPSATQGDRTVHGTAHWSNSGNYASFGGSNTLSSGIYADEFHVFSIIWDQNSIKWYRDDIKYHELDIKPSSLSEFQEEFFFIFNVAVGGDWPGSPNASTQFPQIMAVDYVRVFQK
jgi:hypothetical protein